MTLAEDEVDFRIFQVWTKKLKKDLGEQAQKTKDRILEATYNYCTETVNECFKEFNDMEVRVTHDPANEKELTLLREHIAEAPDK